MPTSLPKSFLGRKSKSRHSCSSLCVQYFHAAAFSSRCFQTNGFLSKQGFIEVVGKLYDEVLFRPMPHESNRQRTNDYHKSIYFSANELMEQVAKGTKVALFSLFLFYLFRLPINSRQKKRSTGYSLNFPFHSNKLELCLTRFGIRKDRVSLINDKRKRLVEHPCGNLGEIRMPINWERGKEKAHERGYLPTADFYANVCEHPLRRIQPSLVRERKR